MFSIGTINLPKTIQSMKTIGVGIMDTNVKSSISEQGCKVQSTKKKILDNRYEQQIALEDKVYP